MPKSNDFNSKNEHKKLLAYFDQVNKYFLKLEKSFFGKLEEKYGTFLNYEVLNKVREQVLEIREKIKVIGSKINDEGNYELEIISSYKNELKESLEKLESLKKQLITSVETARKSRKLIADQFDSLPRGFHEFFASALKEKIAEYISKELNKDELDDAVKSGKQFYLDLVLRGKDILYVNGNPVSGLLKSKFILSCLVKKLLVNSINCVNNTKVLLTSMEKDIENFANKNKIDSKNCSLAIKASLNSPDLKTVFSVDQMINIFKENFEKYKIENYDENALKCFVLEMLCDLDIQNVATGELVIVYKDLSIHEGNVENISNKVFKDFFVKFIQNLDDLNTNITPKSVMLKAFKEVLQKENISFTEQFLEKFTSEVISKLFEFKEDLNAKEMSNILGEIFKGNNNGAPLKEDLLEYIIRASTQGYYPSLSYVPTTSLLSKDKKIQNEEFKRGWDFYKDLLVPRGDPIYLANFSKYYTLDFRPNGDVGFECVASHVIPVDDVSRQSFGFSINQANFQLENVIIAKLESGKVTSQLKDSKVSFKFNEEGIHKGFIYTVQKIIDGLINFIRNIVNSLKDSDYPSKGSSSQKKINSLEVYEGTEVSEKDLVIISTDLSNDVSKVVDISYDLLGEGINDCERDSEIGSSDSNTSYPSSNIGSEDDNRTDLHSVIGGRKWQSLPNLRRSNDKYSEREESESTASSLDSRIGSVSSGVFSSSLKNMFSKSSSSESIDNGCEFDSGRGSDDADSYPSSIANSRRNSFDSGVTEGCGKLRRTKTLIDLSSNDLDEVFSSPVGDKRSESLKYLSRSNNSNSCYTNSSPSYILKNVLIEDMRNSNICTRS